MIEFKNISTRSANLSDLPELQRLFVETIEAVCANEYSPEQIRAWTSSVENREQWTDKITSQYFRIAEADNKIVGYASLDDGDYFDMLYVHKDYQRQCIAGKLYAEIEAEAIRRNAVFFKSDVSKTARPFFEKKGFMVKSEQKLIIKGVELINYKMEKALRIG